ncbi:MAG: hypothetical protein ABIP94_18715 [Planctomycetota bacterium]
MEPESMPVIQVKKVVAICFLEAAKLCLEHIASHRLELSPNGAPGRQDLPRLYGETRRLRDYLQRCASAYQEVVDLDLSPTDQALLVGCCRRAVESIETRVTGDQLVPADEREWLLKKQQVIADWAVELAAKPLMELPLPRVAQVQGAAIRALTTRIANKVFGDVNQRKKILPPNSGTTSMVAGVAALHDDLPLPDDDCAAPAVMPQPPGRTQPLVPDEDVSTPLLDSQKLRDPRLRALAVVDLAVYERAIGANDYRLAAIMLASVLESAALDHAIPRRAELGLSGTPDAWNPPELISKVMGDAFQPKDNALAYHLFSARNLLRPALQMVTPTIVTIASFERLRGFVQRALHAMGYAGTAGETERVMLAPCQPTSFDN